MKKEITGMKRQQTRNLALTGVLAAVITILTAYVGHIPIGINGGYIHLGDAIIYLAATLLPLPYALAAAVIGAGLADLFLAPMWLPATILIKALIVLLFTHKESKIINKRNIIATVIAAVITVVGYFIAEYFIFGTWAVFFMSALPNLIQAVGSAVAFYAIGLAFDRMHLKARWMR